MDTLALPVRPAASTAPDSSPGPGYVSLKIGLATPIVLEYARAIRLMDLLTEAELYESRYGAGSESIEPFDSTVITWRLISDTHYERMKARSARIRASVDSVVDDGMIPSE